MCVRSKARLFAGGIALVAFWLIHACLVWPTVGIVKHDGAIDNAPSIVRLAEVSLAYANR
jgi:hypothetical protein